MSLGLWMLILSYAVSIPLGIRKAVKDGTAFDIWTSGVIIVGYAIPGFLFAIILIVFFAAAPSGTSSAARPDLGEFRRASWFGKVKDYAWHVTLPLISMAIAVFATKTLLTKNSFLDEIRKQYVLTAPHEGAIRAAGALRPCLPQRDADRHRRHPVRLRPCLFRRSLLIETIFSLDGLGLLSYEAILNRDYPVVFANLYIFALIGLVVGLLTDLTYTWIDPRIDFESREV